MESLVFIHLLFDDLVCIKVKCVSWSFMLLEIMCLVRKTCPGRLHYFGLCWNQPSGWFSRQVTNVAWVPNSDQYVFFVGVVRHNALASYVVVVYIYYIHTNLWGGVSTMNVNKKNVDLLSMDFYHLKSAYRFTNFHPTGKATRPPPGARPARTRPGVWQYLGQAYSTQIGHKWRFVGWDSLPKTY